MPTIRIRDWTKSRLDEIRDAESHSSHDSVIKSLLKDRELAASVEDLAGSSDGPSTSATPGRLPGEGKVRGLSVLADLDAPENGVIFLWCPNCCTEVAHFTLTETTTFDVFEIECQRCLTRLDQHAVVAIDLSYPLEVKLVEAELADDLKTAVIDYWDRVLTKLSRDPTSAGPEEVDRLVWQFDQYAREFMWEWPAEVPVVSLEPGEAYEYAEGSGLLEVQERISESGTAIDAFRVTRYDGDGGAGTTEVLDAEEASRLLRNRALLRRQSGQAGDS